MSLIAIIPLNQVGISPDVLITGFEGFTLVWGVTNLRVYREAI